MSNFALIVICLVLGFLLKSFSRTPKHLSGALNFFVIYLSYPALVLTQVPPLLRGLEFNSNLAIAGSMAWIQFGLSFLFFAFVGRFAKWSKATTGAAILTAGLGNTSFVGFPLLEALLGPQALPIGILVDQVGTFLVLSTLGLIVASVYSGRAPSGAQLMKRIAIFPPFLALVAATLLTVIWPAGADLVALPMAKLSATLVPLALVSVGLQLSIRLATLRKRAVPLSLGLSLKLLVTPLILFGIYVEVLGNQSFSTKVVLLESAMAPMITAAIVANEFDLDSELANLMVGIGIPLSLVTVYIWSLVL